MAWLNRMGTLPGATLVRAAGVASIVGVTALGVGFGTGCTLLVIAAYAVIFSAGLVPSAVDWRDSKPRPQPTDRPASTPAAVSWRAPEVETDEGRLVWIEPERQRLH